MNRAYLQPLPKNKFWRGAYLMARRYLRHNVSIQSAALAFYLLFAIFPMLIFISSLLGLLHLDVAEILTALGEILPNVAVDFIGVYLVHVETSSNVRLLVFGLLFSIYFPMRAANTLMRSVRTAYHLGPPRHAVAHLIRTLAYTMLLLSTLVLTVTLMSVSNTVLQYAVVHFQLPSFVAQLWATLRFPLAAVVACFALLALYAVTQDFHQPWRNLLPGVLAALAGWMVLSWIYSIYMENIANYSLLYGSIGTAMALLVWMYMSATALIMGAELNGTLISLRREEKSEAYDG